MNNLNTDTAEFSPDSGEYIDEQQINGLSKKIQDCLDSFGAQHISTIAGSIQRLREILGLLNARLTTNEFSQLEREAEGLMSTLGEPVES